MNAGLLDFFILEASECVERLDGLLARSTGTPDLLAFGRDARALRGSATMAKVQGIAELSAGLERIAKGLHEGSVQWDAGLKGAVVAAIDDLKILIRGVRTWGSEEERRAADRAEELKRLAPARRRSGATPSGGGSAGFLATEMAEVAAGLQRFAENPGPITSFEETLRRVRALRGVAALNDLPPLAEVVATVDEAAKKVELSSAAPTAAQRELFRAAATVLREGSVAVHGGGRPDAGSPAVEAFAAAADAMFEGTGDADLIVPIGSLFPDGAGPHVVSTAPNPPTTPAQRFKLEAVSQAEHLRRLVSDARGAADAPTRQRLGRELRGAVRAMARAAESFSEHAVARALQAVVDGAAALEERALAALEEAAAILTAPGAAAVGDRFEALLRRGAAGEPGLVSLAPGAPISTPIFATIPAPSSARASTSGPVWRSSTPPAGASLAPTPMWTPAVANAAAAATPPKAAPGRATPSAATPWAAAPPSVAPSGAALHEMLGAGIAGLSKLTDEPLSEPVPVDDDGVVPIQDLLYRGCAALRRATELGDTLRKSAEKEKTADAEVLAELYDLLELAATE